MPLRPGLFRLIRRGARLTTAAVVCAAVFYASRTCLAADVGGPSTAVQPGDVVLLDFAARWCGPCRAMAPIVEGIERAGWLVRHVDVDLEHELVKRFEVTGVPCYVLLVKGQEVGRIAGATTQQELERLLGRSGKSQAAPTPIAAAASPAPAVPGIPLPATASPSGLSIEPPTKSTDPVAATIAPVTTVAAISPARQHTAEPVQPPKAIDGTSAEPAAVDRDGLESRLLAATARLRVHDGQGSSRGTGTVIDCRQGEALILTCGHIFRDSGGDGRIEVDLFGGDGPRGVAGQLVAWNLDRDVALVSVFTDASIEPVRVAGAERTIRVGEPVVTVGCDGGADPSVHFSQVTAVDKYLGPANVQVAGQPVQGRSGGGLFALDGSLIGVCNAADPTDDEGLYAALQTVHEQLDEAGLSFVYRAAYPSGGPAPLAVTPPNMPETMPGMAFDRRDRTDAMPTASPDAATAAPGHLTAGELALLEQVRRHQGKAEVICIVRPHGPQATSEVFVLQGAGQDFIDHLSEAHGSHATSRADRSSASAADSQPLRGEETAALPTPLLR